MFVKRKRIFVGCEGKGEKALVVALHEIAESEGLGVHLDHFDSKGGSSFEVVRNSIDEMKDRIRLRGKFDGGAFILLDNDRYMSDGRRDDIARMALSAKAKIILQVDDHEAHLGRVLTGKCSLGHDRARAELAAIWPGYVKPAESRELKRRLDKQLVMGSVAICPEWEALVRAAGFL